MKTRLIIVAVALLVGMVAFIALGGGAPSEQDRVREVVREVIEAAEDAHTGRVIEHVSESYRDENGMDRDAIRALLIRQFLSRGPLLIVPGPIQVSLSDDQHATATFSATLMEGGDGLSYDAVNWVVDFQMEDDDWRITGHSRDGALE